MRLRGGTAALAAVLIVQGAIAVPALADHNYEVLAEGLDSPRGVDVTPDGTVYVAESGSGGDECFTQGEGDDAFEICVGDTSTVTRIEPDGDVIDDFIDGLPSVGIEGEFTGASDVSVAPDGTLYVSIGLGAPYQQRDAVAEQFEPAEMFGTIIEVSPDGQTKTILADIALFEGENNPDEDSDTDSGFDSNPNALLATADAIYVADAGGNTVLAVDRVSGDITVEAILPHRMVDVPPQFGGGQAPMDAVPTSLALDPEGDLVIGQLTGFPFPVGGANVYTLGEGTSVEVLEEGFSAILGVTYRDGELYVLEMAHHGLFAGFTGDFGGALVRVREDGTRIATFRDVLVAPGGADTGPDGMIYVSNGSIFDNGGTLLKLDPSLAADPATQAACPPDEVEGADLSDIADNTHEEAIVCLVWHGLAAGYGDGTFGPTDTITRGQVATTVANLVEATGTDLPAAASDHFSDTDDSVHEGNINALAEAGIVSGKANGTFEPNAPITRGQATTIVVAAYEFVTGEDLPAGPDAFEDDDGNVHEASINAAAAADWVAGKSATRFDPEGLITRGQMASVLARVASTLVADGLLALPA